MENDKSDRLLVEVARLYHERGLTQQEVADQIHTSRINVVKMLQLAIKKEIVQIRVIDPHDSFDDLVHELKKYFGFLEVAIVPSYTSSAMRSSALGYRAARVLLSYLGSNDTVGLGWGSAVYSLVQEMPENSSLGLQPTWVPLIGSMSEGDIYFQTNAFVKTMQKKIGGVWKTLSVPALLDSPLLVEALKSDERIRRIVQEWQNLRIAVFGLGNIGVFKEVRYPSTFGRFLGSMEQRKLGQIDAKGDILARFFDGEGNICDLEYDSRVFGIGLNEIKNVPIRFGIAGGERKADVIYAAAKNKIVNVLVTDEVVALKILKMAQAENSGSVMLP